MEGNTFTRSVRLLSHLFTHPQDIIPYIKEGPLSKKTPIDLEVPWFSHACIRFLNENIKPGQTIFEYGAGGSTLFFLSKGARVVSTEDNAFWLKNVEKKIAERYSLENISVQLQLHEFDFDDVSKFSESNYLNSIPDSEFDIYLVDGIEKKEKVRPTCFEHIQKKVKPGAWIIVDDSWRYPEILDSSTAKSIKRFKGTGPCRPGVTTTDIHFY